MTEHCPPHEFADREPVTTRGHERPWTADLTSPRHRADRELVVAEAVDAVDQTAEGTVVEIVTPAIHGNPDAYLCEALSSAAEGAAVRYRGRCECGSYAMAVTLGEE